MFSNYFHSLVICIVISTIVFIDAGCSNYIIEDDYNEEAIVKLKNSNPLPPFTVGNEACYITMAYFPKPVLKNLLHKNLSIPDDETMAEFYPDIILKEDAHPFLLFFCHAQNVHDVLTKQNLPDYEEILFIFPVIYTHSDNKEYLCSHMPVLYLDSLIGVIGGLYYGFRKEFHPWMEHGEDSSDSKWWRITNIIEASYVTQTDDYNVDMPGFINQTFKNPFVTISYPTPFIKTIFYENKIYPEIIRYASGDFYWNYKGVLLENDADAWVIFSDFNFTLSKPMSEKKFFK